MLTKEEKRLKHNKYNREWAKKHREKYRKYLSDWQHRRLQFYQGLKKGKQCVRCGETHPSCLDFHHKIKADKISLVRRLALSTANNEVVMKEAAKCIILCANCHRKEHYLDQ